MADTPLVIHEVSNRTSRVYFADESDANRYISSFPGSVGGGMRKTRIDVVPPADTPTSAAAMTALHELLRLKGMDAVIDYHYQMAQSPTPSPARERHEAEHDRLVAIRNAAEPAAWEAARAALAQAASAQVEAVQAQPASAPMGEPAAWAPAVRDSRDRHFVVRKQQLLPTFTIPLYSSPQLASPAQARMPLSEEQLVKIAERYDVRSTVKTYGDEIINFARAIEAAHGISGESSGAAPGVQGKRNG